MLTAYFIFYKKNLKWPELDERAFFYFNTLGSHYLTNYSETTKWTTDFKNKSNKSFSVNLIIS